MSPPVLLQGAPGDLGRQYGALTARHLRGRVGRMWDTAAASPHTRAQLVDRGRCFRGFVERIAPEWIDEAEAAAAAAGLAPDDLFVLNALPEGFWDAASGGCTSWLVVGTESATGDTLLHKNRDIRNEVQDFHVRRTPGRAQVFASRDIGNLGFAHFHSDLALAGANNTGSPVVPEERRECGLNCCHLLRLVAERAASCDQAVAVLEDALAKEVAGGSSPSRGMIFLLAEPARGMVVEMTARRLAVQEARDATLIRSNHFLINEMHQVEAEPPSRNTLRRCRRAHELLDPLCTKTPADSVGVSRDHSDGPDSICSDNSQHFWMTQSVCTHVVREDTLDPLAHSVVSMGNPRNTLVIPIPRAVNGLPTACVDGTIHDLSRQLYALRGVGAHLAELQSQHEPAIAAAYASLAARLNGEPPVRIRAELTPFVAECGERLRRILLAQLG